ncbi:MAG TPA: tRNA pseudouridine(55) synthase TruB [Acidimicrobiales bacterium]|jgi:tRNA pseudouridine55 synthase|nr:tRNA pseudouridine(55) synthase TruB [Acidimicrobiales bacterium]
MTAGPDGLAVVDKPAGWTSHDVVAKARGLLGTRKVGHAGTLDPDATGVLVLGVGRVTRLLGYVTGLDKSYDGEVVLGTATSTLDASGEVTGTWDMAAVTLADVRAAAECLTGEIRQVPPMVSAKQVAGRRLHELARAGLEVAREPVTVRVERFEVGEEVAPGVFPISVACSSGTYVRSLAADLGAALGGGAHLRHLRRTAVGPYGVDEAVPLEALAPERLLAPVEALRGRERVTVGDELAALVRHGRVLEDGVLGVAGEGPWAVVDGAGTLLAVYQRHRGTTVKPGVVLA